MQSIHGKRWSVVGMALLAAAVTFGSTAWADEDNGRSRRRGGPRGRGPWMQRMPKGEMSADRVLEFLEEHFPDRHTELAELKENSPELFQRKMRRMMPRLYHMMESFEHNPEGAELMVREERLSFEIHRAAENYVETGDPEIKERLRTELRALVTERVEVRHELRKIEIERLERRLEALRDRLTRDLERRDELIERSLDDLGVAIEDD